MRLSLAATNRNALIMSQGVYSARPAIMRPRLRIDCIGARIGRIEPSNLIKNKD